MTKTQHLLLKLTEECAEVQKEVCKALEFGLNSTNPETQEVNRLAIAKELNDLLAVVEMLSKDSDVLNTSVIYSDEAMQVKKDKVNRYMRFAKEIGELDEKAKKHN